MIPRYVLLAPACHEVTRRPGSASVRERAGEYGAYPGAGGTGMCTASHYWDSCFVDDWPGSGCNRVCGDPFGFIDGGPPGTSYQAIFSPAAKAYALSGRLIPALGEAWPVDDDHPLFLEYMDRWVEFGAWTMPDPCDANAAQPAGNSPADCHTGPSGTCLCNQGGNPRYAGVHNTNADSGPYNTAYTGAMWDAFRACAADCSCAGMDGLCP